MANVEMLRPYIEKQFTEILGLEKLYVMDNGDIPVTSGSSVVFARLMEGPTGPMLRMTGQVLRKIPRTPELIERLNDLNSRFFYVKLFHVEESVYCEMDLFADNIQREEILNALNAISFHADDLDDALQKEFGGERIGEKPPEATAGEGEAAPAEESGEAAAPGGKTGYL